MVPVIGAFFASARRRAFVERRRLSGRSTRAADRRARGFRGSLLRSLLGHRTHRRGDAEVDQLVRAVREHDVRRLHVAVDDARLVRGRERRRDVEPDLHRERHAPRVAGRQLRELPVDADPLGELHHEAHEAALRIGRDRVEADDVGVLHPAERARLVDDARLPASRCSPALAPPMSKSLTATSRRPSPPCSSTARYTGADPRLVEELLAPVRAEASRVVGSGQKIADPSAEGGHGPR